MTEARLVWLLRACVAAGTLIGIFGVAVLVVNGRSGSAATVILPTAVFAILVWFVAPNQPRNPVVWILALVVLFVNCYPLGLAINHLLWPGFEMPEFEEPIPPGLPPGFISVNQLTQGLASTGTFLVLTFGLLLFPDGRLPSRRWRFVAYAVGVVVAAWFLLSIYSALPGSATFLRESPVAGLIYGLLSIAPLLCLASLFVRFRRSDAAARNQIKWMVWGALTFVVLSLASINGAPEIFGILGIGLLAGSYSIAISKYRLYDIDFVISRTLVYGALAVFIGAVYVGIVVGIGSLMGDPREGLWLQILATVVIAIAFQPLRRSLQRVANRLIFGRRATPYEVLSSFSQGVSAVDPAVLAEVARSLAEGTTAHSASIWIDRGDHLQCIAAWPELPDSDPDASTVSEPVAHEGENLGLVALEISPGQPFPPNDRRLLDEVAGGLGLALRNLLLTEDLRDRVDELAASRRRIVGVQDETRRRLERDLHDGAQQQLVSLKIKLGIGASMAGKAGLDDIKALIDAIRGEADLTIESVRDFARGIYPPLLESEGLGPALSAQARKMPIPVTVQAAGVGRYPKALEATIYFCVLEALQNAMKHSEASSVQVHLAENELEISFEVRDDGVGFDENRVAVNGLVNMIDRVEAVGGHLAVESAPGQGTRVLGSVPAAELVPT
jgi:signal transduction histidine kinase